MPAESTIRSLLITIKGTVQGVGFRPFVYKLAVSMRLKGSVSNSSDGVRVRVAGTPADMEEFMRRLREEAPPMAGIASINSSNCPPVTDKGFTITQSKQQTTASVHITPDIAVCTDCLKEIHDPQDRRYQYPFTNCTNCGPRFTIVEKVPYDRPHTSMRCFPMCPLCSEEYNNPLDRRFHAQPNACPTCGPQLSLHDGNEPLNGNDCLETAARALAQGKIVAIKGLGGFHLAADAGSDTAVSLLRERKNRPTKPLAIMTNLVTAKKYAHISPLEEQVLTSPQHPIVLLQKKDCPKPAPNLAAGIGIIGIMLPYTPLHALLFENPHCPEALVMTSGNRADEPICTDNKEALDRLKDLADIFLLHNRDIVTRVDDSIVRVMAGKPRVFRRARGYSPSPIQLAAVTEDTTACGAQMKNTLCITRNNEAYLSQHLGELDSVECLDFFNESLAHLQTVLKTAPECVACDSHPDYVSTRQAHSLSLSPVTVQHHHAHTGAVMAEHGLTGPVLSVILDGTGFGDDGSIFGGEIYLADRSRYSRKAHLSHLRLPGGDKAVSEPWRTALALLDSQGLTGVHTCTPPLHLLDIDPQKRDVINQILTKDINCPPTSSCGRLFDAVSALLGICLHVDYEGQAAMMLEHQAALFTPRSETDSELEKAVYPVQLIKDRETLIIDSAPLAGYISADLAAGTNTALIAYRFHWWLINSISTTLSRLRRKTGIETVTLAGGSMQNKILLEGLYSSLSSAGFTVFSGEKVPVNDGGISLGQAYIAGNPAN